MTSPGPLAGEAILLLVQNLPVPFDRRVWQEALALKGAGAEVLVVCPSDAKHPAGQFELDGIEICRYPAVKEAVGLLGYIREYGWGLAAMSRAVSKARRGRRFSAIHFCNPPDMLFLVAMAHRRGARLVFDQHDLGPELVRAKHLPLSWFFVGLARLLEKLTYSAADHVISTNESYRHIAMTRGRKAASEVTIVRSGPRAEWIQQAASTAKWHEGRQFLVGYVGVMGRQEGIEHLIDAMALLRDRGLSVQLALAGSGPDVGRLRQHASLRGVEDRVTFHGRVSDEDLRSLLSNSDVCVNSDEVNELNDLSTMNKILEYMALGRPIVQFEVTEGRYSAQRSSRYAAPNDTQSFADEIAWVLEHPAEASEMGEFGLSRFTTELSWEQQVPKLVGAYLHVLGRSGDASVAQ